jgi:exopolysaccharide biosynthesis polyprenyl glycosylphosphotransferase
MLASRNRQQIASWTFWLLLADAGLVGTALVTAAANYTHANNQSFWLFWHSNQTAFFLTGIAFLVSFYLAGLYDANRIVSLRSVCVASAIAVGVATLASVLVFYLLMSQKLGRLILLPVAAGIWVAVVFLRWGLVRLTARGYLSQRALVVGNGPEAAEAIQLVRDTPQPGIKIYGVIAETPGMIGKPIEGVPVVGELNDLSLAVETYNISQLIVATRPETEWAVLKRLRPLRYRGVVLNDLMSLHEQLAQEIQLNYVNDEWLMAASMNTSRLHITKMKRLLDVAVSLVGLIVSAPLCLLTAILLKLDSRGPILYTQERVGQDSRLFTLMKFRTMRVDAEAASGPVWAEHNDPRITRLGKWLRKLRIDEIPQLVNVLRGDMSLVGPRPERPAFVKELSEKIPFYGERLLVQPGVTGWAQVNFPYTSSIEETRRKLQYDLYYIKHMSFFLDCLILLKTVKIMLFARERAPQPPSARKRAPSVLDTQIAPLVAAPKGAVPGDSHAVTSKH